MKKHVCRMILSVFIVASLLVGCGKDDIISRTNVYGMFAMDYNRFNSEDSCQFDVEEGQSIAFQVVTTDGSMDVKVVDVDNKELYSETILVSKTFDVTPEKPGRYIVVLNGNKAKGSIDISVDTAESK